MKLKVKFFASFREIAKKESIELQVGKNSTVNDVLNILLNKFPELRKNKEHIIISLNHEYAKLTEKVKDGDELALLPPVSGG